jgi:hypothetical protein
LADHSPSPAEVSVQFLDFQCILRDGETVST